ncbi:TPA: hypothetical protein DIC62_03405 [Candidatus Nomurabacteria bacterium]|nr:hypothetical protein [Candidatus Nomurabacteria bacterium]
MNTKLYKMRVVRGAFVDQSMLDKLGAEILEKLKSEWISIETVTCDLEQIKELQKNMINHFNDQTIPWYMDGYGVMDKDDLIVAFGADDGEGGRIFQFRKDDSDMINKVVTYGVEKGIPKEQMDFMDISF